MKIEYVKTEMQRCFRDHPDGKDIIADFDLILSPRARLRGKVIVFKNSTDLRQFWHKIFNNKLQPRTRGVVTSLTVTTCKIEKDGSKSNERLKCDRRYCFLMALSQTHLGIDFIAHESVHAAYAYAKRLGRNSWDVEIKRLDEEKIAYPAGRYTSLIVKELNRRKLL